MLTEESLSQALSYPFSKNTSIDLLRTSLQKKLVKNLTTLVKEVKVSLQVDSESLLDKIKQLDDTQRFSPLFYFYYFLLLEAVVANNKDKIAQFYDLLQSMCLEEIYHPILTINDQSHNQIINHYLQTSDGSKTILETLNQDEFGFVKSNLSAAMDVIQKSNPDFFHELDCLISVIHVAKGKLPPNDAVSMRYFGWLFLPYKKLEVSENPVLYYFDTLVWESSRLYLDLILTFDAIMDNAQEFYDFPLQNTRCSMKEIFSSFFIFYRLVKSYQFCSSFFVIPMQNSQAVFEEKPDRPIEDIPMLYEKRLAVYRYCLQETRDVVNHYAVLTRTGKKLLENMCV